MIIVLTALLAGKAVLPQIDRGALDLQARAEALQPHVRRTPPRPRAAAPVRRAAATSNPLDLAQITTICRAAGNQADPAGFITRLTVAYSLTADDSNSLRSSCAAYLAGRADARRTGD